MLSSLVMHRPNKAREMGARLVVLITLLATIVAPGVIAVPSGLTYLDSTWSSIEGEGGELIALNPNKTILASYHGKEILFFNTTTLERIAEFSFDEDVSAMEFNPNGSLLAINKRSTVQLKESIRLIDVNNLVVLDHNVQADDSFRNLAWSIDGKILAAQGYDGDVEQYRIPSLTLKNTLHEVHVVDITCIDYRSDGQYILTGDESGRWAVWDLQGQRQGVYREYGQGLLDCQFTPDGADLVFLGENGNLSSREFGQSTKQTMEIDGAKEIFFSNNGNRMHVSVEHTDFKGLNTYDYENFNKIQNTTFFHRVEDLAIVEDEYSRLQSLYVAAGTGEIAVYMRELIPEGYNLPGADLDGDLVPDDLDPDDDGDGLIDDWDDDFGCDAPEGTPCSRYPDLDKIRNIEISVGTNFVVRDQITLPPEDSSNIRNLSRNSIAKDQVISATETQLFADSICQNMDHDDMIEKLKETIILSSGELGDATVQCKVVSGMELIRDGDSTTQITIAITTAFEYDTRVTLPLDIRLSEQTLPSDGSIAWLAPAHPISLTFRGEGVETKQIPLWWNDGITDASITIDQVSVKNPTAVDTAIDLALHPISFLIYLGILVGIVTLIIRQRNQIDFSLDEEEEIEDDITADDLDEDFEFEDSNDEDVEPISVNEDDDNFSKESIRPELASKMPPRKVQSTRKRVVKETSQDPVVRKRRVSSTKLNKDGPITTTKRKRLVSTNDTEENIASIEAQTTTTVKRKKVKNQQEVGKKKIKKRKSVKKVDVKPEEPLIDENDLQQKLVKDFTNND